MPEVLRRALAYVPIAAFSALIAPELMTVSGEFAPSPDNPRLLGGITAIVVAAITRRTTWTIVAGMGIMWLAQFLQVR